jgi:hypothetical protein
MRIKADIIRAIALIAASACVYGPAAGAGRIHMPPGSFLPLPARSRNEVLQQVTRNSALARRYAHAFHTTPAAIIRTFGRMHLIKLRQDLVGPILYVHPGERIGMRIRRLRKGTNIFVSPEGTPILVQICGNPLNSRVPLAAAPSDTFVPDFQPYEPIEAPFGGPTIAVGPTDIGPLPFEPEMAIGSAPLDIPDVSGLLTSYLIEPNMLDTLAAMPSLLGSSDLWWLLLGGVPLEFGGGTIPEPPALAMLGVTLFTIALVLPRGRRRRVRIGSAD